MPFAVAFLPSVVLVLWTTVAGSILRNKRLDSWAMAVPLTDAQCEAMSDLWNAAKTGRSLAEDPLVRLSAVDRFRLREICSIRFRPVEFGRGKSAEAMHLVAVRAQVERGSSTEQAHLLAGIVLNGFAPRLDASQRSAPESAGGKTKGNSVPRIMILLVQVAAATGLAAWLHSFAWWLPLVSFPAVMSLAHYRYEPPRTANLDRLFLDLSYTVVQITWLLAAVGFSIAGTHSWWGIVPGAITAWLGLSSLVPPRWVPEGTK